MGADRERAPIPILWLDSQPSEQGSPATASEVKLAHYQEVGFVSEHIAGFCVRAVSRKAIRDPVSPHSFHPGLGDLRQSGLRRHRVEGRHRAASRPGRWAPRPSCGCAGSPPALLHWSTSRCELMPQKPGWGDEENMGVPMRRIWLRVLADRPCAPWVTGRRSRVQGRSEFRSIGGARAGTSSRRPSWPAGTWR
jgi:hypothetical protein